MGARVKKLVHIDKCHETRIKWPAPAAFQDGPSQYCQLAYIGFLGRRTNSRYPTPSLGSETDPEMHHERPSEFIGTTRSGVGIAMPAPQTHSHPACRLRFPSPGNARAQYLTWPPTRKRQVLASWIHKAGPSNISRLENRLAGTNSRAVFSTTWSRCSYPIPTELSAV